MYELKKMERYLRVNLLGPGPRLIKKEFTGPRSHKGWEMLTQNSVWCNNVLNVKPHVGASAPHCTSLPAPLLITNKYWTPLYKIYPPGWSGTRDLWTPALAPPFLPLRPQIYSKQGTQMNINGTKRHNAKKFVMALDPASQKQITLLPLPPTHSARLSQYNDRDTGWTTGVRF